VRPPVSLSGSALLIAVCLSCCGDCSRIPPFATWIMRGPACRTRIPSARDPYELPDGLVLTLDVSIGVLCRWDVTICGTLLQVSCPETYRADPSTFAHPPHRAASAIYRRVSPGVCSHGARSPNSGLQTARSIRPGGLCTLKTRTSPDFTLAIYDGSPIASPI